VFLGCCSVLMHATVRTRCFPGVFSSVCLVPGLAFLWCNDMVCILASLVLCPCPCGYSPWSCRCNSSFSFAVDSRLLPYRCNFYPLLFDRRFCYSKLAKALARSNTYTNTVPCSNEWCCVLRYVLISQCLASKLSACK
jgi:hypothetical protein